MITICVDGQTVHGTRNQFDEDQAELEVGVARVRREQRNVEQ